MDTGTIIIIMFCICVCSISFSAILGFGLMRLKRPTQSYLSVPLLNLSGKWKIVQSIVNNKEVSLPNPLTELTVEDDNLNTITVTDNKGSKIPFTVTTRLATNLSGSALMGVIKLNAYQKVFSIQTGANMNTYQRV